MLIKALDIRHFRCFQDQHIEIEPLTAILGRNGSGKSTILTALEIFYDVNAPIFPKL
jgi:putative ATP-dependent endonuclease of OLD family